MPDLNSLLISENNNSSHVNKIEQISNEEAPVKRGPGRPSTRTSAPKIENMGIVDSPKDPENRLEFVYTDPSVFKTLFNYFKNIKAREIHMRCTPSGLSFFTRDHTKVSRVIAHISGELVSWYYCDGEMWLGLNRESVEKLFTVVIDKTFYKISIIQQWDDPDSLNFTFKDASVEKSCNYKVTLSTHAPDQNLYESEALIFSKDLLSSPLRFTLTSRQFKKSISDVSNYSELIAIEKIGTHPLNLSYTLPNMQYSEVYHSSAKIDLTSSVDKEDIFRCIIKIAHIKALAASILAEKIHIFCREGREILFRSNIGSGAMSINTLTKLE